MLNNFKEFKGKLRLICLSTTFTELTPFKKLHTAAIHGVAKSRTRLSDWTELNWTERSCQEYAGPHFHSNHRWNCLRIVSQMKIVKSPHLLYSDVKGRKRGISERGLRMNSQRGSCILKRMVPLSHGKISQESQLCQISEIKLLWRNIYWIGRPKEKY